VAKGRKAKDDPGVRRFVEERLKKLDEDFVPGKTRVGLSARLFGAEEVLESLDVLVSGRVTFGALCRRFEEEFAKWCGADGAVFLNSGSSANFLAMQVLVNGALRGHIKPGAEVIVPAVSWSTSVFPILDAGLVPVFVDADIDTLNLDPDEIDGAVTKKTAAVVPVHVLGNPPDFRRIDKIASDGHLKVVEDACEAHGARIGRRKAGTFGDMATFSFYFSHHMTTMEGGMLVSDNETYLDLARVMRAHGYPRSLKNADRIAAKYPNIDARFLFVNRGFNFRPFEVQAAFGIHQLQKVGRVIAHKRELAAYYRKQLAAHEGVLRFQKELPGHQNVYLGFSMLVAKKAPFTRKEFVDHLENAGIETRPVIAGNMAEHPAMRRLEHRTHGDLPRAREIMRQGTYIGAHTEVGKAQREYVVETIDAFVRSRT
jgi:CDP-6-deoxy-D-xylo-4-hexulose-3-dehydrase